jgi:hypothetical protein
LGVLGNQIFRALSNEGPEWTLGTMEHYKPEHFDPAAKAQRIKPKGDVDIFGNKSYVRPRNLHRDEKTFNSIPAFVGLRTVFL